MPFADTTTFQPHPDVESKVLDGDAVLLNIVTGAYFSLNEVGTLIWESYREGKSLAEVSQLVRDTYAIDPERAEADVRDMTRQLVGGGLLAERS